MEDIKAHLESIFRHLNEAQRLIEKQSDKFSEVLAEKHPWASNGILDHVRANLSQKDLPINSPVTIGNGPWHCDDFDKILQTHDIKCYKAIDSNGKPADCEILVVGYETKALADIRELLYNATDDVAVYPQELFFFYLITGRDSLPQLSEKQIRAWIDFHPVLKALYGEDDDFIWPMVVGGGGGGGTISIDNTGSPLTTMGYIVGNYSSLSLQKRRSKLEKIFTGDLEFPIDYSVAEKRSWGKPQSAARLKKIAQHIIRNIRIRHTNKSYNTAVKQWSEDLQWMKKTLYSKKRRFRWPLLPKKLSRRFTPNEEY